MAAITWTKIEGPLSGYAQNLQTDFQNSSVTYMTNELIIISTTKDSHGVYRCSASNSYGSVHADVFLNFFSKFNKKKRKNILLLDSIYSC